MLLFLLPILIQSQCISLRDSSQCPEYKDYSVVSFAGFRNVQQFDAYVQSRAALSYGSCNQGNLASIRYGTSFVCGLAVFSSTKGNEFGSCNQGLPPPTPVCQSTVNAALNDLTANLARFCRGQGVYPQYTQYAQSQTDNNCLLAIGSEKTQKCGFTTAQLSNDFCSRNQNALCCTATGNQIGTATSASVVSLTTQDASATSLPSNSAIIPGASSARSTTTPPASAPSSSSNAQSSQNSNSSTGGINPLLIGAGALGLALIAVLASVLFFMTKKGKVKNGNTSMTERDVPGDVPGNSEGLPGNAPAETMECVFEYKANLFDELTLEVGDEVQVLNKFDDGWALGYNLTSGKEGTFPLACLAPFGAGSEYASTRGSQYSKRASSMFAESTYGSNTFGRN